MIVVLAVAAASPLPVEDTATAHLILLVAALAGGVVALGGILVATVRAVRRGDRVLAAEAAVNGGEGGPGLVVRVAGHDASLASLTASVSDLRSDLEPIVAAWPSVEKSLLELSPNSGSTWRDEYARDRDYIAASLNRLAGALDVQLPDQPPPSRSH